MEKFKVQEYSMVLLDLKERLLSSIPQGFPETILALGNLSVANCMTAFQLILPSGVPNNTEQKGKIIAEYFDICLQTEE